jgi:hypothetical protein
MQPIEVELLASEDREEVMPEHLQEKQGEHLHQAI